MNTPDDAPVACPDCFVDTGLRLDAVRIGREVAGACPSCGKESDRKLPLAGVEALAHRYFVWGSLWRAKYGAAPLIQFNQHQKTSIELKPWLQQDVGLFERLLGIGFFHYGPRFWMFGEVEPLKALQRSRSRSSIIKRILEEYPARVLAASDAFYRLRVNPTEPGEPAQYDSPPLSHAGRGRLDSKGQPVLYGSPDLDVCIHECRTTVEDDVFVATLNPTKDLHLLDLSVLLREDGVTEFESLDLAVHMLFLAGRHSYAICRAIADSARDAGFDGLVYPSYFSLLRIGQMPFQTVYGISQRRIEHFQEYEESKSIPNLALFGRPVEQGRVAVRCIDRLVVSRVRYEYHFGPTGA